MVIKEFILIPLASLTAPSIKEKRPLITALKIHGPAENSACVHASFFAQLLQFAQTSWSTFD
jgi:hypothetical protein